MLDSRLKDLADALVADINSQNDGNGDNEARAYAVRQLVGSADFGGKVSSTVAATGEFALGAVAAQSMVATVIGEANAALLVSLASTSASAAQSCAALLASVPE